MALVVRNPSANTRDVRDVGWIPGSGRSSGGGHGNPLQYSCLENLMDRGAWWATVQRVAKSQTWKRLSIITGILIGGLYYWNKINVSCLHVVHVKLLIKYQVTLCQTYTSFALKHTGLENKHLAFYLCLRFPGGSESKESTCNAGARFNPWVRKIPWSREWLPTPHSYPKNSMHRGAWQAAVHGSQWVGHDWVKNTLIWAESDSRFYQSFLMLDVAISQYWHVFKFLI